LLPFLNASVFARLLPRGAGRGSLGMRQPSVASRGLRVTRCHCGPFDSRRRRREASPLSPGHAGIRSRVRSDRGDRAMRVRRRSPLHDRRVVHARRGRFRHAMEPDASGSLLRGQSARLPGGVRCWHGRALSGRGRLRVSRRAVRVRAVRAGTRGVLRRGVLVVGWRRRPGNLAVRPVAGLWQSASAAGDSVRRARRLGLRPPALLLRCRRRRARRAVRRRVLELRARRLLSARSRAADRTA
jgi:hypothetical protein